MKKVLSVLLIMLLMLGSTGFASKAEEKTETHEIDFSVLLGMPGFTLDYNENNQPQWFSYEDQYSLIDENGCYVIPCAVALQTGIGDFMVLQLDVGHYATPENMVGITEFSILVDERQYTFSNPQLWADSTEEYGMILCGQDALAMLKGISSTTSPVYIVLKGEKESFAYEMTKVQQSVIQSLVEGGEKAGLFSSEMALTIAQSYTPATVSAISAETEKAVAGLGTGQNASNGSMGTSSQEGPQVDFSVFENLSGFTADTDEETGYFAVYNTDTDPLYTKEGCVIEPLIGSIMHASGYAPVFFLSLAVDRPAGFIIHEAAFMVEGNRYTFSPSRAGNAELSNVFRISCGQTAQKMLGKILRSTDPVEIELTGESETISFTMTSAQKDALQTLYNAYLASGAATHEPTLDVAENLSPVLAKVMFAVPAPTTEATTDADLPIDPAPFENLPGIVTEKNDATGQYRFIYSDPAALMDKDLCFLDPYVTTDIDQETNKTILRFILAATNHKTTPEKLGPTKLRFLVDGIQYEISGGAMFDTDSLVSIAVNCGAQALEMVDKIIASPNPVTASIVCGEESIDFILSQKQIEVLKSLYDAYMLTDFAKDEALLREADTESPVAVTTNASARAQALGRPVIELDDGVVLEDKSFIIHSAQDNKEHYAENGCFLEPVFVYDAEVESPSLFCALAIGQDLAAAPPERVTIAVDGKEYTYKIELSKGFLHLTYALIPCEQEEFVMIDALLRSEKPTTVTLTTKDKNMEFSVTEKQKELLKEFNEE